MKWFLPLFCSMWGVCCVWSDVGDWLKKAENKTAASPFASLDRIDYIYMINLDQRREKWEASLSQLTPYGIVPYRFSAVNGWELSAQAINEVGVCFSVEMRGGWLATSYKTLEPSHEIIQCPGQTYFGHCQSRGAIGIALSHISILQDAYDAGYETIWVMEDDIEVIQDPRSLSSVIERLDAAVGKDNWDILFTDRDIKDRQGRYVPTYFAGRRPDYVSTNAFSLREQIDEHFIKIGARSGAHSMIIRKTGIKKLLTFFKAHSIFLPYDMDFILPQGIRLFTVTDDIVSNLPGAASDNGGPTYPMEWL